MKRTANTLSRSFESRSILRQRSRSRHYRNCLRSLFRNLATKLRRESSDVSLNKLSLNEKNSFENPNDKWHVRSEFFQTGLPLNWVTMKTKRFSHSPRASNNTARAVCGVYLCSFLHPHKLVSSKEHSFSGGQNPFLTTTSSMAMSPW